MNTVVRKKTKSSDILGEAWYQQASSKSLLVLRETKVRLLVLGQRDLVGLKAVKDNTEPGDLGSNMSAGKGPLVLAVLRWFVKVR